MSSGDHGPRGSSGRAGPPNPPRNELLPSDPKTVSIGCPQENSLLVPRDLSGPVLDPDRGRFGSPETGRTRTPISSTADGS